ncbi:putative uncharacterized protein DDB_G0291608 [Drosophila santomea]|uniref:putative uncharacterized protein DDB_G0291608 n=1 Tax=Drosophila santomea TaxID=129105 RepID=UPI001CCCC33F|nr:putative uncharacterized protein DDB_G0291608 [Drosophila santomea]
MQQLQQQQQQQQQQKRCNNKRQQQQQQQEQLQQARHLFVALPILPRPLDVSWMAQLDAVQHPGGAASLWCMLNMWSLPSPTQAQGQQQRNEHHQPVANGQWSHSPASQHPSIPASQHHSIPVSKRPNFPPGGE